MQRCHPTVSWGGFAVHREGGDLGRREFAIRRIVEDGGAAISAAPPPADTLPPGLADHADYEILRELGRGGMGVVYLAQNKLMGRLEVLKVVGRHLVERPGVLDRFLREIQSAAKLHHTNIVTAYSALRLGESLVLAMEYVEGLDLAKMVKTKGPLPVAHACYFIHQAALGLQHAHERGMVHRDIKPANLILAREGKKAIVKVLDFGLAKVTQRGPGRQRTDPRGPDAGHAGLHRPGTDPQRPVGRHPRRHLQPGLYVLLSPDRRPAVPRRAPLGRVPGPLLDGRGAAEPGPPRSPGRAGRPGGQDDGEGAGPAVSDAR